MDHKTLAMEQHGERLFAVHGLSERTTVQTSSLLLRLFFFHPLANPTFCIWCVTQSKK